MKKHLTWTIPLILALSLSFLFFTRSKQASPANPSSSAVVIALGSAPRTLDPRYATDANGMRLMDLLFSSLVRLGPNLKVLPNAASRWTYKNKTYTFTIPRHLKFSNGRAVTKADLLFSFKQYQSPQSPFASAFQIIKTIQASTQKDNIILKIQLKNPSAKFLTADLPVLKILPKLETLQAGRNFYKNPIGTGPFQLTSQNTSRIILTARTHTSNPPNIHQAVFKIIRDDFTRFQKILNGEIDIAQSELPPKKALWFLKHKTPFKMIRSPGLDVSYILLNFKAACLKNKKFRTALAQSINRTQIIQHKLHGMARPALSLLSPESFFHNPKIKLIPYNPAGARRLLQTIKHCQTAPLILKSSRSQSAISHARVIAAEWRKIGLKTQVQSYEWGTFYNDLNKGRFQTALLKWVGVLDPDIYRLAFHSSEYPPRGRNRGSYNNPLLDTLLSLGSSEMNRQKRKTIYNQAQKIIASDIAIIPLWHSSQINIVKNNIKHYHPSQRGDFYCLTTIKKGKAPGKKGQSPKQKGPKPQTINSQSRGAAN